MTQINFTKYIGMLLLFAFAVFAVWGLGFGVQFGEHGRMARCPFMGEAGNMCGMNVAEHISLWEQIITAIIELGVFYLMLLAVFFRGVNLFIFANKFPGQYLAEFLFKIFSPLSLALSRGIVHPKIF